MASVTLTVPGHTSAVNYASGPTGSWPSCAGKQGPCTISGLYGATYSMTCASTFPICRDTGEFCVPSYNGGLSLLCSDPTMIIFTLVVDKPGIGFTTSCVGQSGPCQAYGLLSTITYRLKCMTVCEASQSTVCLARTARMSLVCSLGSSTVIRSIIGPNIRGVSMCVGHQSCVGTQSISVQIDSLYTLTCVRLSFVSNI